MKRITILLLILLFIACSSIVNEVDLDKNIVAVMVYDKDEIICKNLEITGSRLKKKVCATKREWEQMELESKDYLKKVMDRSGGLGTTGAGNGPPTGN